MAWRHSDGQHHPLAGIVLQRQLEANAYVLGGGNYNAPGQLGDFRPRLHGAGQRGALVQARRDVRPAPPCPPTPSRRCARPCPFGRKIKGFDMHDAVLTGVETRTSSPLKIGRGETSRASTPRPVPGGRRRELRGRHSLGRVDGIKVEAVARSILTTPEALRTFPFSRLSPGRGRHQRLDSEHWRPCAVAAGLGRAHFMHRRQQPPEAGPLAVGG
jgi:hypothetical protein